MAYKFWFYILHLGMHEDFTESNKYVQIMKEMVDII